MTSFARPQDQRPVFDPGNINAEVDPMNRLMRLLSDAMQREPGFHPEVMMEKEMHLQMLDLTDCQQKGISMYGIRLQETMMGAGNASLRFNFGSGSGHVHVEGRMYPISEPQCDLYFHQLSREQQIETWVRIEEKNLMSSEAMDRKKSELEQMFGNRKVPRPDGYMGYICVPEVMTFIYTFRYGWQVTDRYDRLDAGWACDRRVK
ncbi:MAG: hypothetical protein H6585_07400 [Flavobacteriales bacterium]|nr:hypothetical protein [Flavobacteriales bacterium]MCB9448151.1 hypothetical protein [Flavobacteriales bacterium]